MKSVESVTRTVCVALALFALPAVTLLAEELNAILLRVNDEIATLYDYEQRKAARVGAIAEAGQLSTEERRITAAITSSRGSTMMAEKK